MKKVTQLKIGPVALLVLLVLLTLLVVKRKHLTAEEAADAAARTVVRLEKRGLSAPGPTPDPPWCGSNLGRPALLVGPHHLVTCCGGRAEISQQTIG